MAWIKLKYFFPASFLYNQKNNDKFYSIIQWLCASLGLSLKHSSERPCEQEFFLYVQANISIYTRTWELPSRGRSVTKKRKKTRGRLKGKIDKHENPSKILLFSDGWYIDNIGTETVRGMYIWICVCVHVCMCIYEYEYISICTHSLLTTAVQSHQIKWRYLLTLAEA